MFFLFLPNWFRFCREACRLTVTCLSLKGVKVAHFYSWLTSPLTREMTSSLCSHSRFRGTESSDLFMLICNTVMGHLWNSCCLTAVSRLLVCAFQLAWECTAYMYITIDVCTVCCCGEIMKQPGLFLTSTRWSRLWIGYFTGQENTQWSEREYEDWHTHCTAEM